VNDRHVDNDSFLRILVVCVSLQKHIILLADLGGDECTTIGGKTSITIIIRLGVYSIGKKCEINCLATSSNPFSLF
jgi:hypothetical protein